MQLNTPFTATDYYTAALSRFDDLKYLRQNQESLVFAVYCAGTAIECLLRAYLRKETPQFNAKHNLNQLYIESKIVNFLEYSEIEKFSQAMRVANQYWNNNLRYSSIIRIKRLIVHELVSTQYGYEFKDIYKYINKYYAVFLKQQRLLSP